MGSSESITLDTEIQMLLEALPILNADTLEEATGGDREFARELAQVFASTSLPLVHEYTRAVAEGRLNDAVRAVHTLKGSSRTIGLERLGEVCSKLEDWVRSGATGEPVLSDTVLAAALEVGRRELDAHVGSGSN